MFLIVSFIFFVSISYSLTKFLTNFLKNFLMNFLTNILQIFWGVFWGIFWWIIWWIIWWIFDDFFRKIFFTYDILTIASFRIGVPSILLFSDTHVCIWQENLNTNLLLYCIFKFYVRCTFCTLLLLHNKYDLYQNSGSYKNYCLLSVSFFC